MEISEVLVARPGFEYYTSKLINRVRSSYDPRVYNIKVSAGTIVARVYNYQGCIPAGNINTLDNYTPLDRRYLFGTHCN
jgi:hypothetical protein